jgi:hypothetical protein
MSSTATAATCRRSGSSRTASACHELKVTQTFRRRSAPSPAPHEDPGTVRTRSRLICWSLAAQRAAEIFTVDNTVCCRPRRARPIDESRSLRSFQKK